MKKRALSLLMAFVMVVSLLPATIRAADKTGNISVGSAAALAKLGGLDIEGTITLTADIDMSGTTMPPIKSLTGCFNGDGKTISGLVLTGSNYSNTGLIGQLDGSVINLKMTGAGITDIGKGNNAGILVGSIPQGSTSRIDNCYVDGTIKGTITDTAYVGGLVGKLGQSYETSLTINNSVSNVQLNCKAANYVGGLVGVTQYSCNVTVANCTVLGNVVSHGYNGYAGGLFGSSYGGTLSIENTIIAGKITGKKKGVIACATVSPTTKANNFYYDSTLNPPEKSFLDGDTPFPIFPAGYNSVTITGEVTDKTTQEIKELDLTGFEKNADGYPVPMWTPASAPEPTKPPFSCALTFTGVPEGGELTVKHGGTGLTANADNSYSYTLSETGDYTYSVTFGTDSDYNGVPETGFTVNEEETAKTIKVPLTYKTTEPFGDGTEASPYEIGTAAELRWFANQVNGDNAAAANAAANATKNTAASAYVKLTRDITVSGSWTPLGENAACPFSGCFDGAHHSVTITVDDPSLSYFGFFGCLSSEVDRDSETSIEAQPTVVVKNLTVNGTVYCSEPYAYVGGLAACARGKVELENCTNNAAVSALARGSAGVGGYDDGVEYVWENISMTLNGCANNGTISVTGSDTSAMVGGLVGSNKNCVQLTNCTNSATINAPGCTVGGLLGEAGSQTGDDCVPTIKDCGNTGTLIGASGKTNNLYGKGTLRSGNVTSSGDNTYTGGSEFEDELLLESQKYGDVFAVSAKAAVGDSVTLIKTDKTASDAITVTVSQGERDTNKAYLKVVAGKLQLARKNETGKVVEATATITWSKGDKTLSKPITVNIYPAANTEGEPSARRTLMDAIAETYTNSSSDWVVFDMAVYAKLDGTAVRTNEDAKTNYLNLTVNELAGNTPLVSDRAKAEIILAALGVNSTQLTPYGSENSFSNAAKLAEMDLGSSHYTAPWVLLAEQAGRVTLTDTQRNRMIALLTESSNLGEDGVFFTRWAGETYADPDTTGTALAALAKYNTADYPAVQGFITEAIKGLSAAQGSNGSFGNVNSDAMVIVGLTAVGVDPGSDTLFVKNGCSLADALLLYVNDANNGFTTPAVGSINGRGTETATALATEQGFRALIALEKFDSLAGDSKSYNIYTQLAKFTSGAETTTSEPIKLQSESFTAKSLGTVVRSASGSSSSSGEWISVAVTIQPGSGSAWYSGSVKVAGGATVKDALCAAAEDAGLSLNIKSDYLRSVTRGGVTLSQLDDGPNSGWMYKVNGEVPNVSIADYKLTGDKSVLLYYTEDYTKEYGTADWDKDSKTDTGSTPSTEITTGGGRTERVPAAATKTDGTSAAVKNNETSVAAPSFTDVSSAAWYADAVQYAYENSLMTGVSESEFAPSGTATRGQIVTILWRLAGSPVVNYAMRYADVSGDSWYGEAVRWASAEGVVTGYSESSFAPDDAITREQLAAILYRYAKAQGQGFTGLWYFPLSFTDADGVSSWADEAMHWCVVKGVLNGTSETTLSPTATATRAQLAAILQRFCELSKKKDASSATDSKSAAQTAYGRASTYLTSAVSAPRYDSLGGEWTVLALTRGGADTKTAYFTDYYTALEQTVHESKGVLSERKYTEYSRVILALSALGKDARSVAGYDLTLPLGNYEKTMAQGVNGAIYALLALDSRDYPMPQNAAAVTQATRQLYVDAILADQLADGGWSFMGTDADPDLTAMALQALAKYQEQSAVKLAIDSALVRLSAMQNADGGFSSWGSENAESCAQVLLALNALGLDVNDSRFVKNGRSVSDTLLTYQTADGGFCHERGGETNLMASEQAVCALASLVRAERGESSFYQMAALTRSAAA